MTQNPPMEALTAVVNALTPQTSDERKRIIRAALAILGEADAEPIAADPTPEPADAAVTGFPPRTRAWMRQFGLDSITLAEVIHIDGDSVEIIAPILPGKTKKDQALNAYILAGILSFLATGKESFDDKSARALCEKFGCYDSTNHAGYLKDKGNEFAGSKDKGWMLTAPGLKRGADMIKEMAKGGE